MSCENCDRRQDGKEEIDGSGDYVVRVIASEGGSAYYRWKNANIQINGCDKHLREIFTALNEVQKNGKSTH